MQVREAMSTTGLQIGPGHTLRDASRSMISRRVGAAVVHDPDGSGIGIITERDVLEALGAGQDVDSERVSDHLTSELVFAAPSWTLDQAADAMTKGGFRHLIVLDAGEVAGIVAVRDIGRCWHNERTAADELVG